MRRILRLFRPYRARLAVVLVLIAGSAVLGMLPPFLLRAILDQALPHGRTGLLALLAAGMLALMLASNAIGVWQAYVSLGVGENMMNDLRIAVYAHLQRMPLAFFTRTRTGEVQSRISNDIGGMGAVITTLTGSIVGNVTTVVASLVAMLALDWRLTLLSLLMVPVFAVISRNVGDQRRAIVRQRQEQQALLSVLVEESLSVSGFLLGRVMGRTETLVDQFSRQSGELTRLTIRSSMAGRWRAVMMQIIMGAMPIAVYCAAGFTEHDHHLAVSVGTLVAFTTLQQGLFGPTVSLLGVGITLQSSLALFERIFEYLDLPIELPEPADPVRLAEPRGHLRFENVYFSYGDRPALSGVTLDVPAGSHLAVVGATGAGKTTLGYLIPRLYDVTSGRITLDGTDLRDLDLADLASIVSVVSQETHLFHTTIGDNLRFARPQATAEEVIAASRAAQIHDLIESLPDGYDTVVGERGYRFSGGEKQRLAITRTMLRDPKVLVLDEATSALDTRTERSVQKALDRLRAGRTTITIAHRLSTVRSADLIVVLDGGRIVEQGTHAELLARQGYYARLLARDGRAAEPMTEASR
ncbi:ABC transporter ATP-binding protein [Streptomyces sp. HPF1205]|uniref:ABC transporter ATP-binding protein n=1 Tax=Streptomyces sp. HPF1205 TaxID=2873262 RepID=UPI001CED557E|nr:ABC transporter ATP-binding protein [Streptomyces sp. HPF1205]